MAINFLKNLFEPKAKHTGIVFIVEDNTAYAKTLELYLKENFSLIKEVKVFPVGETALMEISRNPDLVIIDYFLNSKYHDAVTGLETIRTIREQKPEMNIIVLSGQDNFDVMLEAVQKYKCSYVNKDAQAFEKIAGLVRELGSFGEK